MPHANTAGVHAPRGPACAVSGASAFNFAQPANALLAMPAAERPRNLTSAKVEDAQGNVEAGGAGVKAEPRVYRRSASKTMGNRTAKALPRATVS
jgi:hypothetical protein